MGCCGSAVSVTTRSPDPGKDHAVVTGGQHVPQLVAETISQIGRDARLGGGAGEQGQCLIPLRGAAAGEQGAQDAGIVDECRGDKVFADPIRLQRPHA